MLFCLCKGVRSPGTVATDSCEAPRGCWRLNPGSLEKQTVLFTAEPSPAPGYFFFPNVCFCLICQNNKWV